MSIKNSISIVASGLSLLLNFSLSAQPETVTPVQQDAEWAVSWWMERHEEKLAEARGIIKTQQDARDAWDKLHADPKKVKFTK